MFRHSYSDQSILPENVYAIRISKDRSHRDGMMYALTSPNAYVGYKNILKQELENYEAIEIQGVDNVRLTEKDKQFITEIIESSPHLREIAFVNIAVKGFSWIPCKEKITNLEYSNNNRNAIIDFEGIELFPDLQRIYFHGFFEKSRNFECIAKLQKPLSVFSEHTWFGKNIELFGRFRLKALVVTEFFMQEMRHITSLDYPELLEVLEFYNTLEMNLELSALKNLKCLAFCENSNSHCQKIKCSSLVKLDKLESLYLSEEAIDDVACLEQIKKRVTTTVL